MRAAREAEIAGGGTGWEATTQSIYWQQRVFTTLHTSIASRLMSRLTLHAHVRARFGLGGVEGCGSFGGG